MEAKPNSARAATLKTLSPDQKKHATQMVRDSSTAIFAYVSLFPTGDLQVMRMYINDELSKRSEK